MWTELYKSKVAGLTDQAVADLINEAGGSVGRQSVGQWRKGAAYPSRSNVVAMLRAFEFTYPESQEFLRAWLISEDDFQQSTAGRVVAVVAGEATGMVDDEKSGIFDLSIMIWAPGAMRTSRRVLVGQFQMLIQPMAMDEEAMKALKIHKVADDIHHAPGQGAAIIAIRQFLRAYGYPPLVAYTGETRLRLMRAGLEYRNWVELEYHTTAFFERRISLHQAAQILKVRIPKLSGSLREAHELGNVLSILELCGHGDRSRPQTTYEEQCKMWGGQ